MTEENDTRNRILAEAVKEFKEKGFLNSSLRNISKAAGVTTGAFYRYYDSKEALFGALVDEQAEYIINMYNETIDHFEGLPDEQQTEKMNQVTHDCMREAIDYIYDNLDAFRLLVMCSEGTKYADFQDRLVEREVESTYFYLETLEKTGHHVEPINKNLIHIIASGQFKCIFETVAHNMPKEEALEYVTQLRRFYTAGWEELMGVSF